MLPIRYLTNKTGPRWTPGPGGGSASTPLGLASQAGLSGGFQGNTPGLPLDAYLYPPPNSQTLLGTDFQASVGAGTVTPLPLTLLTVPQAMTGVINSINMLLDGITITSVVQWQLLVNGAVAPGYQNLRVIPRSGAASVSVILSPVRVPLGPGATAVLQAINQDGAPYHIGGQLYGWFWPFSVS